MTEKPGPRDPAERQATDRPGKGVDVFGELQRWFIRQSAKNMRREISGQVRRTLGGGRETSDVWDTATNEIPPEVGESPECQWCPICRAARRMRDSGPGIGGQLSGAGDVVASAVQDAISALDSLLAKGGGTASSRENASRDSTAGDRPATDTGSRDRAPRESPPAGESDTSDASADPATASRPGSSDHEQGTPSQPERDGTASDSRRDRHGLVGLPGGDSAAAESATDGAAHAGGSGPAGEPADRPTTAQARQQDPWGAATEPVEAGEDSDADAGSDGSGHGPDDRG